MKTLFATLVIVGLATCTIGSEAVNRERDYLREATTTTTELEFKVDSLIIRDEKYFSTNKESRQQDYEYR